MGKRDKLSTEWLSDMERRTFVVGAAAFATTLAGCEKERETSESDDAPAAPTEEVDQSAPTEEEAAMSKSRIKLDRSTPGGSKVFATDDLSADGLLRVFHALGWEPTGKVAIKLHMGEEGNTNYLDPELLRPLVEELDGTFVDTTVLYYARSTADGYRRVAANHGFTYAPVDILDEDGGMGLPIEGGRQLSTAEVGSHYADYGSMVSVAHFKGHGMAGFGGTFKNLAIGLATCPAKRQVHGANFDRGQVFLERVVEFAKGVFDDLGPSMACVNVINKLSVDCDCDAHAAAPAMGDIGIMASLDPVALDRASLDQIYLSDDPGKDELIERIESLDGAFTLDYAEELGLGSQTYELVLV